MVIVWSHCTRRDIREQKSRKKAGPKLAVPAMLASPSELMYKRLANTLVYIIDRKTINTSDIAEAFLPLQEEMLPMSWR